MTKEGTNFVCPNETREKRTPERLRRTMAPGRINVIKEDQYYCEYARQSSAQQRQQQQQQQQQQQRRNQNNAEAMNSVTPPRSPTAHRAAFRPIPRRMTMQQHRCNFSNSKTPPRTRAAAALTLSGVTTQMKRGNNAMEADSGRSTGELFKLLRATSVTGSIAANSSNELQAAAGVVERREFKQREIELFEQCTGMVGSASTCRAGRK